MERNGTDSTRREERGGSYSFSSTLAHVPLFRPRENGCVCVCMRARARAVVTAPGLPAGCARIPTSPSPPFVLSK